MKNITLGEAAKFLGIGTSNLRNLIRRGDFSDVAESVPSVTGSRCKCFIKAGAFMQKYGLTWADVEEMRSGAV